MVWLVSMGLEAFAGDDVFLTGGDQSFTGQEAGSYDGFSASPATCGYGPPFDREVRFNHEQIRSGQPQPHRRRWHDHRIGQRGEGNQPGQLFHLLPGFRQGTLQLVALVETGLYFGKGDSVDDERSEVHPGVPVAVKGCGIMVTRIPISRVPNYGGNEGHDNARPLAQVPSHHGHGRRVEREQAQLIARGVVNPSEHSEPEGASGEHNQCPGFAAAHDLDWFRTL